MPYITKEQKDRLLKNNLSVPVTPGELNFMITDLILVYMAHQNAPLSYQTINDVVGALECAKQEFYRRLVTPFEEVKIKQNGDVY